MDTSEFTPELYTLTDEEGNDQLFELLDVLEEDNERYFAFLPYFETPEDSLDDDGDLVILKATVVDGEEMMASIDEDEEYERIGNIFLERLSEVFESEFIDEGDE